LIGEITIISKLLSLETVLLETVSLSGLVLLQFASLEYLMRPDVDILLNNFLNDSGASNEND